MANYESHRNKFQRGNEHPRRGFSYESHDSNGRNYDTSRPASSQNEQRGKGRGGHPPHLTGKAIGLYYRDLVKSQRKQGKKEPKIKKSSFMDLDLDVYNNVNAILDSIELPSMQGLTSASYFDSDDTTEPICSRTKDSHFKRKFIEIISGNIQENIDKTMTTNPKLQKDSNVDKNLVEEMEAKRNLKEYKKMHDVRSKLPAFSMREEILDLVVKNQVVVISGETGCGKTTQVAQFILDDAIDQGKGSITKIVCTQPRRISAVSVAERVAAERVENLGRSVGFQIRLEKVLPRSHGSIVFCTTGLLLQQMQHDPALLQYSHIILDEIHERNTESDFIITLLKQIIPKRRDLKVILMSATLDSNRFSTYYNCCPNIHIPGFTYPVTDFYLEDVLQLTRFRFPPPVKRWNNSPSSTELENCKLIKEYIKQLEKENKYSVYVTNELRQPNSEELSLELIRELLEYICEEKGPGAILVFLPGMMDIEKMIELLNTCKSFQPNKCVIYPLHSRLPTIEQKLIFNPPPDGKRKIIIATTIAEASITIEDVVYVIDCGRAKLKGFDSIKNIETLDPEWITLANVKQRRGRAGRVQPGECYHLFTRARESTFAQYPPPEMLRTSLEQVILQTKLLQLGDATKFLSNVMDPPEPNAIELALELLRSLDALDDNESLTPLGYHLAKLPLDPRIGKMIIWAALFSCIDPILAIAAGLAFKDPFYCPFEKRQEARMRKSELAMGHCSDHIAVAQAVRRYESCSSYRQTYTFCNQYFLSWNTLKLLTNLKREFARHLHEMKFLESRDPTDFSANRNSSNFAVIKAVVCIGLYPNVAKILNFKEKYVRNPVIETKPSEKVKIHPGSINATTFHLPTSFLTFYMKQRSTAIFLHDTTFVSWTALFFSAPRCCIKIMQDHVLIELNETVKILCATESAKLIQRLRTELDVLLENKITDPCPIKWDSPEGHFLRAVVKTISQGYPKTATDCLMSDTE